MKKILFSVVAMMMTCLSYAQSWNFPTDANGNVEFSDEYTTSGDASSNFAKVKNWINGLGCSNMSVVQENTNNNLTYTLTKNTKSSYNPFAGQFTENLIFSFSVTVDGNKVSVKYSNIQIQEIYAGYGVRNKITALGDMVKKYTELNKQINDATAAGDKKAAKKLKKENEDYLENTPETLENASEQMTKMRNSLKVTLGV